MELKQIGVWAVYWHQQFSVGLAGLGGLARQQSFPDGSQIISHSLRTRTRCLHTLQGVGQHSSCAFYITLYFLS